MLERQQLSFYESLDLKAQQSHGIKGIVFVKDAEIKKGSEPGRPYCLQIIVTNNKSSNTTTFQCDDAQICSVWFQTLIKAAKLHKEESQRQAEPLLNRGILGFSADQKLTKSLITKTYKKLCLQAHPDKGGDMDTFNKINSAYSFLIAYQEEQDAKVSAQNIIIYMC